MGNIIGFVLLAIGLSIIITDVRNHVRKWREEDAQDEEEEQLRANRQRIFDLHAHELARAYLMRDAALIHFAGEHYE